MANSIVVLEKWNITDNQNDQRLIYDAEQDRIIHQFKDPFDDHWLEDVFTSFNGDENWANTYLSDFNNG